MTTRMDLDKAISAELQRLEMLLMDPATRRDHSLVTSLLSDDFIEFGSSGRVWTRDSTLEQLSTETFEPPTVEDFACRMLSENVALATYRTVRREATGERDEKLRSSIWTRESGMWKVCFHQATRSS